MMPLKHPLPKGRTHEQLWNHFQVESRLAKALMSADRDGRQKIFARMYDELFAAVPDHPRLTRRSGREETDRANESKLVALQRWLTPETVLMEFAPGDGEFSGFVAPRVGKVIGIDISDQRQAGKRWPDNFQHVIYDGFSLPQVAPGSIDVAFSDQLLEHLHPEDALSHLALVRNCLKPGGCYVIRTPHAATGPWDVSRYFCDQPEGFHLKEWTYSNLNQTLLNEGYSKVICEWNGRGRAISVPLGMFRVFERFFGSSIRRMPLKFGRLMFPGVLCVAVK